MILQEKIQKKAEGFGQLAPVFLEGAEFALENQLISTGKDLSCNHKELLMINIIWKWMHRHQMPDFIIIQI